MQLTQHLPWLLTAVLASLFALVSGVQAGEAWLSWLSVILFALCVVATGIDINRVWWRADRATRNCSELLDRTVSAALQNAQLMVLAYLWGALAMIAVYRLTGLRWQHGVQYGVAMALMATAHLAYAWLIAIPDSSLRHRKALQGATVLVLVHGGGALVGVLFLVLSGKILSGKSDWAANQIFLGGGLAIAALAVISILTNMRLMRMRIVARESSIEAHET